MLKQRELFFGDNLTEDYFLELLTRVDEVYRTTLPPLIYGFPDPQGLLIGPERYNFEPFQHGMVLIEESLDIREQVLTFAHELLHIPFMELGVPPSSELEALIDRAAEYFCIGEEYQLTRREYLQRVRDLPNVKKVFHLRSGMWILRDLDAGRDLWL